MDVAARVLADSLDKSLGQRLLIENRPGSGNIGAEAVAKSDPTTKRSASRRSANVAINPYVYTDMTFDPLIDLIPVAPVTSSAILVVANAKVPANNLTQLIALAKEKLEGGRSVWSSWDLQRDRLGMRGYARSP